MEEITIQLSFPVWCVLLCLCAMTLVAWLLLWEGRHTTNAQTSRLGVSAGGISGCHFCLCSVGSHTFLMDVGASHEFGDALKTVKG